MGVGLLETGGFPAATSGVEQCAASLATTALSFISILALGMRGVLAAAPPELSKLDAVYRPLDALYPRPAPQSRTLSNARGENRCEDGDAAA